MVEAMIKEKEVLTNGLKRAVNVKKTSKPETTKDLEDNINDAVLWHRDALKS